MIIFACMKEFDINIRIRVKLEEELSAMERVLLDKARQATYRSYSPYSRFSVGAAVELEDGSIVEGSNQENAAYPSGLCAERTCMFYANSRHPNSPIRRLCIAARNTDGNFTPQPVAPCGACRQALLEAELRAGKNIEILLYGTECIYCVDSVHALLPLCFDGSFLE